MDKYWWFPWWPLMIGVSVYYLFPIINKLYLSKLPELVALALFIFVIDRLIIWIKPFSFNEHSGRLKIFGKEV